MPELYCSCRPHALPQRWTPSIGGDMEKPLGFSPSYRQVQEKHRALSAAPILAPSWVGSLGKQVCLLILPLYFPKGPGKGEVCGWADSLKSYWEQDLHRAQPSASDSKEPRLLPDARVVNYLDPTRPLTGRPPSLSPVFSFSPYSGWCVAFKEGALFLVLWGLIGNRPEAYLCTC